MIWGRALLFLVAHAAAHGTSECKATEEPTIILHIPKSGGTTLCNALRRVNYCTGGHDVWARNALRKVKCWEPGDGPEWCCVSARSTKEKTCAERCSSPKGYTMIDGHGPDGKSDTILCGSQICFRERQFSPALCR